MICTSTDVDYNASFCPYTGEKCEYLRYGEINCNECKFKNNEEEIANDNDKD